MNSKIENLKSYIGKEVYAIDKQTEKVLCTACRGAHIVIMNNNQYNCTNCNHGYIYAPVNQKIFKTTIYSLLIGKHYTSISLLINSDYIDEYLCFETEEQAEEYLKTGIDTCSLDQLHLSLQEEFNSTYKVLIKEDQAVVCSHCQGNYQIKETLFECSHCSQGEEHVIGFTDKTATLTRLYVRKDEITYSGDVVEPATFFHDLYSVKKIE